MVVVGSSGGFSTLTRRNGIKVGAGSPCSVEDVCLAVGEVIGHSSIKSAARMNGAAVLFVEKVEQANLLVESGISVNGSFLQVSPLTQPATKIILSNVPPFVSDEFLVRELSRHGKVVSPVKKILSGCKSPLLKHVVSHRRQLFMILNKRDEELNLRFRVKIDDFDYILFATSSTMKCFGCGQEGHLIKMCPNRAEPALPAAAEQQPAAAVAEVGVSGEAGEPAAAEQPGSAGNSSVAAEGPTASGADGGESVDVDGTMNPQSDCVVSEGSTVVCGGGETCVNGEERENLGEMEQDGVCGDQGGKGEVVADGGEVNVEKQGEGEQVMEQEAPLKLQRRSKRKNVVAAVQTSKQACMLTTEKKDLSDSSDSEGELSDSSEVSLPPSNSTEARYPIESFINFLQETKGLRGIKLEKHFPNLKAFYFSARYYIRRKEESGLSDTEIYRLRKLMGKVRKQL